jgi:hypothetical protein
MDDATRKELEAIKRRVEAATAGEWDEDGTLVLATHEEADASANDGEDWVTFKTRNNDADRQLWIHARRAQLRLLAIIEEQERQMRIEITLGDKHYGTANQLLEGLIAAQAELATARRSAFDEAIGIVSDAPDYSDGDGLRSLDPRGLNQLVTTLRAARDTESKEDSTK